MKRDDERMMNGFDGLPEGDPMMAQLKQDLKRLAHRVPECQLSQDRLKDAVLGAAVQPKFHVPWTWILGPAGACALALLIVANRTPGEHLQNSTAPMSSPSENSKPEVPEASSRPVDAGSVATSAQPMKKSLSEPTLKSVARSADRAPVELDPARTPAVRKSRILKQATKPASTQRDPESVPSAKAGATHAPPAVNDSAADMTIAAIATASPKMTVPAAATPEDVPVVISSEVTAQGVSVAKEVELDRNVVVGG